MQLRIVSDLHLEFGGGFELPVLPGDAQSVLVLAGDIDSGDRALDFGNAVSHRFRAVIQTLGNHEYYGSSPARLPEKLRTSGADNVHLLENQSIDVGEVRFIGGTLWTDFKRNDLNAIAAAEEALTDFRKIRFGPPSAPYQRRFRATDARDLFARTRAFIAKAIGHAHAEGLTPVVVTHHAPYLPEGPQGSALSFAFGSDLSDLIEAAEPALWIHGHTHVCSDFRVGVTRVISNQRGYPGEGDEGFDPGLVVKID